MAYGMSENGNYRVRIAQAGGGKVEAFVPETFQLAVTSQFNQPFGQGIQNSTVGTAAKMLGLGALTSQSMTAQVWEGTQPIEMSLELEFVAESDPTAEVLQPIKELLKMTMPSKGGGGFLLDPPGPVYKDIVDWKAFEAKKGEGKAAKQITVQIGNFLLFDSVVIESVNTTFHSMMHSSGVPLRATCAVTFKTFFIQLKEDIPALFMGR
jgi:hypothetical protein